MSDRFRDWLDHRTGYRKLLELLLIEHIPGGAKWRYVWGSCLAFVFCLQLLTGLLLMTAYSPGDSTAWASVHFIQYQMDFGWLIRGLHHVGSQTMVVLLGIHMLQVVIAGAHLPPREINWWLGLGLLAAVLGLSLTGYLLPWDQKGYWATQVATNIVGNLPLIGSWLQKIIVGGPVYGHHTLTRFFTLHVAVLPPLIVLLIIAHVSVFRRHGVTTSKNAQGEGWFWPDQAYRDFLVSMIIFGIMLGLILFGRYVMPHALSCHKIEAPSVTAQSSNEGTSIIWWDHIARAGRYHGLGANLDAPADPSRPYPARPEWYFLFLFQLLKYFEGDREVIGTVVIPMSAGLVLFLIPLLGYGRIRIFGHVVGSLLIIGLLVSLGSLTYLAIAEDRVDQDAPLLTAEETEKLSTDRRVEAERNQRARKYQADLGKAQRLAKRAVQLAMAGVPADGPISLLRRDPLTRGPELFGQYCTTCHNYGNRFTSGTKASDLQGLGTEEWIYGLLQNPGDKKYFGNTQLTGMIEWRKDNLDLEPEDIADLKLIAKWLASHPRGVPKRQDQSTFGKAFEAFDFWCAECHVYEGQGGFTAPDLTGYADADWIRTMIMSPDRLHGKEKNAMPMFRDLGGPDAAVISQDLKGRPEGSPLVHLGTVERELIIRWLTKNHRVVFGGDPVTAPEE